MTSFRMDFSELHTLKKMLTTELPEKVKVRAKAATLELARLTRTTAIERIHSSVPSGTTYARSHPRRLHTASAPGQPPAVDLGSFVTSIFLRKITGGYRVGTTDFRGELFEFGGHTGKGFIAPRPWLFPAVEEVAVQASAIYAKHMRDL